MTYQAFKTFACIMIASLFINVAVVVAHTHIKPVTLGHSWISQENQVYSYLVSLNTSKGARHYHMTAGHREDLTKHPELYLSFSKYCFSHVCKDCNDLLKHELTQPLLMIQSDWRALTGCGVIKLIDREGIHRWTLNEEGQLKYNISLFNRGKT